MKFLAVVVGALCALVSIFHSAAAAERTLDHATLKNLSALVARSKLRVDAFPVGPTRLATVEFERVPVYADDAHVIVESASGRRELPRSDQVFLRGRSADGAVRMALVLNADASVAHGNGEGPEGAFAVHASAAAHGASALVATKLESDLPAGFNFEYTCGNESMKLDASALNDVSAQLQAAVAAQTATAASTTLKTAIVAIDTDSLFLSRLFSNNTVNATNWIAGMFNTMTVMYERDLNVRLLIGTTILRVGSANDPYTAMKPSEPTGVAMSTNLNIFGSYWKTNESAVPRSFAILLSGQIAAVNGCSASGIAWINQYCQKGFAGGGGTVGSYSVTQVCTNIGIDPNGAFDARIVGHELGHNFGAYHTHCTNKSTGAAPTGTNTIDACYNLDSNGGCYSGTPSCPAAGSGTIMSYCNSTGVSGCAAGTQNQLAFHPTHVSVIQSEPGFTGTCLSTSSTPADEIFKSGFQ
jgi:hypothetical protein